MVDSPPDRGVRDRMSERFFQAIGIDPTSTADQRKIRDAIRWVETRQEAETRREAELAQDRRERRSRYWVLVYGAASTLLGIGATAIARRYMGFP